MSSNKFAHWNSFPFATVRKRSQQTQSLLFRLPRELRDLIYEHYAHEETGYEYHYASGKMMHRRAEPPDVIRLSLALTCRRVAEEIKNVGWQANTIHFSPLLSVDDGTDYLGERSRAARFKNLLYYAHLQRNRMLVSASAMIRAEDLVEIDKMFPTVARSFRYQLNEAIRFNSDHLGHRWADQMNSIQTQDFYDLRQHLLDNLRRRDPVRFHSLVAATYGHGRSPVRGELWRKLFVVDSFNVIYNWKPTAWTIPLESELCAVESISTRPWAQWTAAQQRAIADTEERPWDLYENADHYSGCTKWYFSATAVAIDFMQRLSPRDRQKVRSIQLDETFNAVSRPESRVAGLIPLCVENPRLRVERHVALLENILPLSSDHLDQTNERQTAMYDNIGPEELLVALWMWIDDAIQLPGKGMPLGSFKLIISSTGPEMQQAWSVVKTAAMFQEALGEWAEYHGKNPSAPMRADINWHWELWPLQLHIPPHFAQTIRDIALGVSPLVELSEQDGVLWDAHGFFEAHRDWTEADWREGWRSHALDHYVKSSFYADLRSRYRIVS